MKPIEIKGSKLLVNEDLYWDIEDEFEKAVTELLKSAEKNLTIDLSKTNFIFSPFMGHIVRFCITAKEKGKEPSIIVNPHLEEIFRSSGLMSELPIKLAAHNNAG